MSDSGVPMLKYQKIINKFIRLEENKKQVKDSWVTGGGRDSHTTERLPSISESSGTSLSAPG